MSSLETYQAFYGALSFSVRPIIIAALIGGYWFALRRANIPSPGRQINWAIVSALVIGWYAVVWWLASRGSLAVRPGQIPPLPLGLIIPIGIGLLILPRVKNFAAAIKVAPIWFLIGLQVYRLLGGNFIALWALGAPVPGIFALPAGIGDVITGALAMPVAFYVARQGGSWRAIAIAWNLFGIVDLINALTLGVLTSPGPFQVLALGQANLVGSSYPTVLTPYFAVPLSLVLHGLSLWQLRQHQAGRETSTMRVGMTAA